MVYSRTRVSGLVTKNRYEKQEKQNAVSHIGSIRFFAQYSRISLFTVDGATIVIRLKWG